MKARKIFALALLSLMTVYASTADAQSDRGTLTGVVKDPSGALVPNAKVTATNFAPALAYLGMTRAEQGQHKEAMKLYERALAVDEKLAIVHYLAAEAC